jgi:uncharacterized small protein (DUF1192 family)
MPSLAVLNENEIMRELRQQDMMINDQQIEIDELYEMVKYLQNRYDNLLAVVIGVGIGLSVIIYMLVTKIEERIALLEIKENIRCNEEQNKKDAKKLAKAQMEMVRVSRQNATAMHHLIKVAKRVEEREAEYQRRRNAGDLLA